MKIRALLAALVALCAAGPAFAANNYVVKDGTGTTITMCSKDTGAGVQAGCHVIVDSGGTEVSDTTAHALKTLPGPSTTMGCTLSGTQSAASTNATNVKASAGTICGGQVINTTTTIYYLRLYNLSSAPTASSSTGYVLSIPIPPATASGQAGGLVLDFGPFGAAFSTGIGFVITGGGSSTDNTNAATGVFVNLAYK